LAHGWPEPAYTFVVEELLRILQGIIKQGWPPFMINAGIFLGWVIVYNFLFLATSSKNGGSIFVDRFADAFRKFKLFIFAIIIGMPALFLLDAIFQLIIIFIPPLEARLAWPTEIGKTTWLEAYFEFMILSGYFFVAGLLEVTRNKKTPTSRKSES